MENKASYANVPLPVHAAGDGGDGLVERVGGYEAVAMAKSKVAVRLERKYVARHAQQQASAAQKSTARQQK